jgi:hypothetical protein
MRGQSTKIISQARRDVTKAERNLDRAKRRLSELTISKDHKVEYIITIKSSHPNLLGVWPKSTNKSKADLAKAIERAEKSHLTRGSIDRYATYTVRMRANGVETSVPESEWRPHSRLKDL